MSENEPETETGAAPDDLARHASKMAKKKAARDKIMATKTGEKGLIIVHTGKGKGKSTAAFGMIFRHIAHRMPCAVVRGRCGMSIRLKCCVVPSRRCRGGMRWVAAFKVVSSTNAPGRPAERVASVAIRRARISGLGETRS